MNLEKVVAFATIHPWFVPLLLIGVFCVPLTMVFLRTREVLQNLRSGRSALAEWKPEDAGKEHDLCAFTRPYLLGLPPGFLRGWEAPRVLVSRDIEEILDAYVERRTSTVRFIVGPLATALALICTFFLIAHVLENDVYNAVGASSASAESASSLATAVKTLGGKFNISAAGIAVSLLFAVVVPFCRRTIYRVAHETAREVGPRFCTPATLAAAAQVEALTAMREAAERDAERYARDVNERRAVNEQHGREAAAIRETLVQMNQTLHATRGDLQNLRSIQVTIQDLSAHVTTQLRQMLTNDIGEQMKDILATMMGEAAKLSDDLQTKILAGFEQTIQKEIPRIIESLTAIQKSVEGQAQSPMEQILDRLQGVVSGGMQGESAQLSSAMKQFADVVPALAEQLRSTAEGLTTEMRSRSDENARASETLMSQVGNLLQRLEAQQSATDKLVSDIGQAAARSAESMVQQVHKESAAVFENLLSASRNDVDQLLSKLREATNANAGSYEELASSVKATSSAILEARDGLHSAAVAIKELTAQSRGVIAESRQAHELAAKASEAFNRTVAQLGAGVESMRAAIEGARTHALEQGKLLDTHRVHLAEIEKIWPTLFEGYLKNFDAKSEQLLSKWDEFYRKTTQFSNNAGASLAEAAEDLKVSVDRLASLQQPNNGQPKARHP